MTHKHIRAPGYAIPVSMCHRRGVRMAASPANATCPSCMRIMERLERPKENSNG